MPEIPSGLIWATPAMSPGPLRFVGAIVGCEIVKSREVGESQRGNLEARSFRAGAQSTWLSLSVCTLPSSACSDSEESVWSENERFTRNDREPTETLRRPPYALYTLSADRSSALDRRRASK